MLALFVAVALGSPAAVGATINPEEAAAHVGETATGGPGAQRKELVKQLVTTKAMLQTSLSLSELINQETKIRASTELADRDLSNAERRGIGSVAVRTRYNGAGVINELLIWALAVLFVLLPVITSPHRGSAPRLLCSR
jgi:hypothetical protein